MNVREIIKAYLKEHGFDGLVDDDGECGCLVDNLMPCDAPCETCRPGFRGPDPEGESEWLIYPTLEALAKRGKEADRCLSS